MVGAEQSPERGVLCRGEKSLGREPALHCISRVQAAAAGGEPRAECAAAASEQTSRVVVGVKSEAKSKCLSQNKGTFEQRPGCMHALGHSSFREGIYPVVSRRRGTQITHDPAQASSCLPGSPAPVWARTAPTTWCLHRISLGIDTRTLRTDVKDRSPQNEHNPESSATGNVRSVQDERGCRLTLPPADRVSPDLQSAGTYNIPEQPDTEERL